MSIKIIWIEGLNCPHFVCDICGESIETKFGAAVFDMRATTPHVDVLHVHKGKCFDLAEARMGGPGGGLGWDELHDHIQFLKSNAERERK